MYFFLTAFCSTLLVASFFLHSVCDIFTPIHSHYAPSLKVKLSFLRASWEFLWADIPSLSVWVTPPFTLIRQNRGNFPLLPFQRHWRKFLRILSSLLQALRLCVWFIPSRSEIKCWFGRSLHGFFRCSYFIVLIFLPKALFDVRALHSLIWSLISQFSESKPRHSEFWACISPFFTPFSSLLIIIAQNHFQPLFLASFTLMCLLLRSPIIWK